MQQESTLLNNKVEIFGKVVSEFTFSHFVYGEGFYNFSLEVQRLSESCDVLPVTVSERLIDMDAIVIGTLVQISGQIRSYNNYLEQTRKNKLVLTVFVRELEVLETPTHKNPNNVYLNGYICKLPIFRATPFGREIADVLFAVNRSYNKSDYIPCIAWGRNARFAGKLCVGDNMEIWGRMQSRNYQKKYDDGTIIEKTAYEISISKIEHTPKENVENETLTNFNINSMIKEE